MASRGLLLILSALVGAALLLLLLVSFAPAPSSAPSQRDQFHAWITKYNQTFSS